MCVCLQVKVADRMPEELRILRLNLKIERSTKVLKAHTRKRKTLNPIVSKLQKQSKPSSRPKTKDLQH